jgi:DNA-binding transcriptional LysR family regulator
MELRDIEYFAVVAEHGHVGRAAEALGLGQPALSKSLRRLEQGTGARLFARTAKGMQLTAAGTALLSRVRRLRLALDDVAHEIADIGQGRAGHLRIGVAGDFIVDPVSEACKMLLCSAPDVTLSATVETGDSLLPAVVNGNLDLAILGMTASPHENIVQEHLFDDEFVVIASRRHRLAVRKRVTMADLAQERWILSVPRALASRTLFRAFEAGGLPPPRVVMNTPSLPLRDNLVAATDLLGYGSSRVARTSPTSARFVEIRVKGLEWRRRVGVAYRSDAYLSPVATRFIEWLKSTCARPPAKGDSA